MTGLSSNSLSGLVKSLGITFCSRLAALQYDLAVRVEGAESKLTVCGLNDLATRLAKQSRSNVEDVRSLEKGEAACSVSLFLSELHDTADALNVGDE